MPDHRKTFYDSYVSTFKRAKSRLSSASLQPYYRWCDYRILPSLSALASDSRILEIGCGPGYLLEYLAQSGFTHASGIDISAEQIEQAQARGCDAKVANVFDYLVECRDTFDAVIAIDLLEHFDKDELVDLSQLIHSALRTKGLLLVQTVNGQGLFPGRVAYGDLTHMTILTPGSLDQLLRAAGFQDCQFMETGPIPAKGVKRKIRRFLWRIIKGTANLVRIVETGTPQEVWTECMVCHCHKY